MDSPEQLALHGTFLRERNRYDEAIAAFKQALAGEPNSDEFHYELALTYLEHDDEKQLSNALDSINKAIGLNPEEDHYYAVKGLIYINQGKSNEARKAVEESISIYPENILAWTVKGHSYFETNQWAKAEADLRQALTIDSDSDYAKNLLAIVLRAQGNVEQSEEEISDLLSNNAEDDLAHANAGWVALQQGKRDKAEEHFKEALRLSPTNEYARDGLREAYKARSIFFRLYLKYQFFMGKFSQGSQIAMMVGLFIAFKFGRTILAQIHPALSVILVVVYLLFAFWTILADGIGHFILLKDRLARLTLNKKEKLDGLFVGGGVFLGAILALVGFILKVHPVAFIGAALVMGSIPWSSVFLNKSKPGKIIYLVAGAGVYLLGIGAAIMAYSEIELSTGMMSMALLISFASTWISLIPGMRK